MATICDCEDRKIHLGRFQRCRKHATTKLRLVDTRTIGDLKAGKTTPEPGSWWSYCASCATVIKQRQGATVEEKRG